MKKIIIILGIVFAPVCLAGSPVQCFKDAKADRSVSDALDGTLTAKLCSRATSSAPVQCFKDAKNDVVVGSELDRIGWMRLCSGANSSAPVQCYNEAKASGLDMEIERYEIVKLCGNPTI